MHSRAKRCFYTKNGKRFPVDQAKVGVNLPPMHPYCRSTTIAVIEDGIWEMSDEEIDKLMNEIDDELGLNEDIPFDDWLAGLKETEDGKVKYVGVDKSAGSGIIKVTNEKGIENDMKLFSETHTAAGNRRSPLYELSEADVKFVQEEITAINANTDDFIFNSNYTRGTCFLASDGKVHIKGNIFPDEYSDHPRDKMSVRAVLAHEYYGHRPYREQYIREDNDTSDESISKIMARAWADEFRASYMAAQNAPNLSDDDRRLLILDSLSRAEEAGISIKYNDFIRRVLYG